MQRLCPGGRKILLVKAVSVVYNEAERSDPTVEEFEKVKERLADIEKVIARGPFHDDWASLSGFAVPDWYQKAKFGIFIHWGAYAVPAFGNEWYPRNMYQQGTPEFEHHRKVYGPQDQFGYRDIIPLFKAEKFDAAAWADLFKEAGVLFTLFRR